MSKVSIACPALRLSILEALSKLNRSDFVSRLKAGEAENESFYEDNEEVVDKIWASVPGSYSTEDLQAIKALESPQSWHIFHPTYDGEDDLYSITSLVGLEACANLEVLELEYHECPSLEPLSGLQSLRKIRLHDWPGQEVDATPLLNLSRLEVVELPGNHSSLDILYEKLAIPRFPSLQRFEDTTALADPYQLLVDALQAGLEKRFTVAFGACDRAKTQGAKEADVLQVRAWLLQRQGRPAKALALLRELPWSKDKLAHQLFGQCLDLQESFSLLAGERVFEGVEALREAHGEMRLWIGAVQPEGYAAIATFQNEWKAFLRFSVGESLDFVDTVVMPVQAADLFLQARGNTTAEGAMMLAKAAFFCFKAGLNALALLLCDRALAIDSDNPIAEQSKQALVQRGVERSPELEKAVEANLEYEIIERPVTTGREIEVLEYQYQAWLRRVG